MVIKWVKKTQAARSIYKILTYEPKHNFMRKIPFLINRIERMPDKPQKIITLFPLSEQYNVIRDASLLYISSKMIVFTAPGVMLYHESVKR